jgi:hypothetical protein
VPELEQFAQDLHQEVLAKCSDDTSPQMREDAFTECVLERLAEHNEADNADIIRPSLRWESRGRFPAAKINAWALSGDDATLDLFATLYHGSGEPDIVSKPDVAKYFGLVRGFLRRAIDGFYTQLEESHDAFEAARRIHAAKENLATVRLFFITDGVVGTRAADVEEEPLPELELRYVLWDLEKLSRLQVGEHRTIELNFSKIDGGPIGCIAAKDATSEYQTFLAFLPAPLLAKIYGEYGQRLLERNVRAFLQVKNKVNKGLQQTLRDEPHRFLAYNNGLCCTAAEVDVEMGKDGHGRLKGVKDFQIVNGGQTTASIFHALKKERVDIANVVVQVKLTVLTNPAKVMEIVPLISRYANSQNKVNTADFSANGKFHHQLEQLSRNKWAPPQGGLERGSLWYYERARGSYLDDKARKGTPAKRREFEEENPPHQKFTKTDLAKFEHAWLGLPHLVCKGAEKNFIEFAQKHDEDGEPMVDLNYFKHLVAKAILFRTTEKLVSALEFGGYRANIVAYTIAWLAEKSGRRIDLETIWSQQKISLALCNAITEASKAANEHLLTQAGNVGEASKRAECWEEFRKKKLNLPTAWENELAASPFVAPTCEEDAVAAEWEKIRRKFTSDTRTIEGLEAYTGKVWIPSKRRDLVAGYAALSWDQLRRRPGLGLKKLRALVEMFAAALD